MNSGIFNNPFRIWGKYRRRFRKATLTVSFQFHHTRMDGAHAGRFLALLQENIRNMKGTVLYGETDNPDCCDDDIANSGGDLIVHLTLDGAVTFENSAPDVDRVSTERLFERFFTVRGARGSTGLGLSIAGLLRERMGGIVQAEWHAGRLTVRVRFPSV